METIKTWFGGFFLFLLLAKFCVYVSDSKEATSEAKLIKEKIKFITCFCKKRSVPLSGVLNALEKDSGYELECRATAKNKSEIAINQIRVKFNFLTERGYNFDSFEQWSEADNYYPGTIISVSSKPGFDAPKYNSRYKKVECELIDIN
ncbi:hypothetical protein [Leptospira bandrabouensis]|uniref:hypothetical protein n=1 Tax=Leptospira bandrabouensis TaxID=2484903 RepID=UPI001EE8E6F6|nr:hypothetical protein [Leptospira bandrabouensis]MCG6146484.1 hypothetical protein [Leptospira bandrabouensis]MCG6154161.1 hypothetical protein [Leptospira bandrabouensis]MCG6161856.1 hypothetical protein [Leptospira bandrabouensis]MCG6166093.1 hypothetical protein [Leptospira bandrabouensis]